MPSLDVPKPAAKKSRWLPLVLLATSAFVVSIASARAPAPAAPGGIAQSSSSRVTIEVRGVGCATCVPAIRRALLETGGVLGIAPGEPRERLIVEYESGPNRPDVFVRAIQKAGFDNARIVVP